MTSDGHSLTLGHHGQRSSDYTVLTATGFVNGEREISTPYRIETPKLIDIKFEETIFCAKFGANPSTVGFWANS